MFSQLEVIFCSEEKILGIQEIHLDPQEILRLHKSIRKSKQ
jgi:hypothetical protein